ncbi:TetR family transcriptional regulator [Rhizobium sp. AC27/96]|uniref:TetR/AcrR family transcriptional regulator n=1 Tax=Rhizobium sp. AC27/96 TaxID=1841653 RepID=UPI000827A4A3|nr:TetR/AcrR family transcriptional regulator [Rhizobium sp. AC27/96]OCJ03513.1 TetR family transcriptional regulator [Rhizobium sp. AC27/96]
MSTTEDKNHTAGSRPRSRLSREDRYRQLIEVAWRIVGEEGTEALTLGRLSERAGVTKPVVYDHFATRPGLLAALYREFDERQNSVMDGALQASALDLIDKATVIATSYVDCVLLQGREIPGIIAALAGSPELEAIKREYETAFIEKCRATLAPFASTRSIATAGLWAMLGAAESLSYAASKGDITPQQAKDELFETIKGMVARNA